MERDLNLLSQMNTTGRVYAIDASSANKELRTGVENYAHAIINKMKNHALKEGERVVLYSYKPLRESLSKLPEGWESRVLAWPPRRGWMRLRVAWELFRTKPDVFFVPSQGFPMRLPGVKTKFVSTIHDVAFKRRPDLYEPKVRKRLSRVTRRVIKSADILFVPSEATKNDLLELYRVPADRIVVTLLAPNTELFRDYSESEEAPILRKHRLGTKIFFVVGRLEKKKNITTLIRGFELFKKRRGMGDPYELVFAGKPGYGYAEIKKYLDHSKYKDQIRVLGYVEDLDVAPLMSAATAYVFPSWYEGFGIPNLEAMASGTALITSDIPVHREVVGDAGLFVLPGEPEGWEKALDRIVREDGLVESLVEKGFERVKHFSWEETALNTWNTLRTLV
jgi:glycosyltransferase involved in cell wall biosynthesis